MGLRLGLGLGLRLGIGLLHHRLLHAAHALKTVSSVWALYDMLVVV